MLRETPLPISFAGLNTKVDPKHVPVTYLVDLQNATFAKGPGTLCKRNGHSALGTLVDTTGLPYGTPNALAKHGSELIAFSNGRAFSYRESTDNWTLSGEVSSVVAETIPIARTGTVQVIPDVAVRNGVQVVAWEDSRGGVWCTVLEEATKRHLLTQFQLDPDGLSPRCVYSGANLLVLWTRPSESRLMCAVINTAEATADPVIDILSDDLSPTLPFFDAESIGPAIPTGIAIEPAIVAWVLSGGGYRVGYIAESGVLGSVTTNLPGVASYADTVTGPIAVTVCRNTEAHDAVAVVWVSTHVNVRFTEVESLDSTFRTAALGGAVSDAVRLSCCFGRDVDGDAALWWIVQESPGRTDESIITTGKAVVQLSTYDAQTTSLRGHELVTRAFYDGPELAPTNDARQSGDVYAMVSIGARFFTYVGCIRLSAEAGITGGTVTCVARLLPGEATATHFRRVSPGPTGFERIGQLSSVIDRDKAAPTDAFSRRHATALSYRIQLDSENGDQVTEAGVKYTTLDFDDDSNFRTAELGRGLYLASAGPQHYDGDRWGEAGYHTAPDWGFEPNGTAYDPTGAFVVSAGGDIPNGIHPYKLWYEDVDAQGEVHRGPVSVPVLITTSGDNGTVTIEIPTYKLTNKRRVRLCVARAITDAEGQDETIAYYRVSGIDPSITTGANCMVFNDPTVPTLTFVDTIDDEELLTREPLYTNGGIRSNDPAPWRGDCIAVGKNRLFWSDSTDPNLVRFSKIAQDDIGLGAPASFSIKTDPFGGAVRGLWVMDDNVYVGKESAIYVFGGPGPADAPDLLPEQNAFTTPALVTTDVGLANQASVGIVPTGTLLMTTKGVMLLDRGRQIVRIGEMVDGYKDQHITQTTLLPDRPHILMLTDSGRTLLFDYENGMWSTFTNHEGYGAQIIDGTYHYLRTDGRVFRETPGLYSDAGNHIPMVIVTSWVKLAGYLQGFQSVLWAYFLGNYVSPHTLRMMFRRDYSNVWLGPVDMDVNTNYAPSIYGSGPYGAGRYGSGGVDPTTLYQRRVHLNQKCQAIQFWIQDVEAAGDNGAAFELNELLVIGGVEAVKAPIGARRSS